MTKNSWTDDKRSLDELVGCEKNLVEKIRKMNCSDVIDLSQNFIEIKQIAEHYTHIVNRWKDENLHSFEKGAESVQRMNSELDSRVYSLLDKLDSDFRRYYSKINPPLFFKETNLIKIRAVRKKLTLFAEVYSRISKNTGMKNDLIERYLNCIGLMQNFDFAVESAKTNACSAKKNEDILLARYEIEDAKKDYLDNMKKIKPGGLIPGHKPFCYNEGFAAANELLLHIDLLYDSEKEKRTSGKPLEEKDDIYVAESLLYVDSDEKIGFEYDKSLYRKTTALLESHPYTPLDCKELKNVLSNRILLKGIYSEQGKSLDKLMKQRCSNDYMVMAESRQGVADAVLKKEHKLNDTQITKLIKNLETYSELMDFQKHHSLLNSSAMLRFSFDKSYLEQDIESLNDLLEKRKEIRIAETKSFLTSIVDGFSNFARDYWKESLLASLAVGEYCLLKYYSGNFLSPLFNSMAVAGGIVGAISYVRSEISGTAQDFFKNGGVGVVVGAGIGCLVAIAANACGASYIPGMNFKELQIIEGGVFGSVSAFLGGACAKEILKQYGLI